MKPHPTDPRKILFDDPITGKQRIPKAKPEGFDEHWEDKHPKPKPKPDTPAGDDGQKQTDGWAPKLLPPLLTATAALLLILCAAGQLEACAPAYACMAVR